MQLKYILGLGIPLFLAVSSYAQTDKNSLDDRQEESRKKVKKHKKSPEDFKDTEVNFLLNYYEQDGDHSPVTGGQGTEELENIAPSFVVHVPLDSLSNLDLNFGVDVYSSASTDNIDYFETMHKSSASSQDARVHFNAAYSHHLPKSGNDYSVQGGLSVEYDVTSFHFGGSYTFNSKDQNRSLTVDALLMNDMWQLLYPVELRGAQEWLKDDTRLTSKLGLSYSQVVNRRLQALFSAELVYQTGLLSTPFHRVFFDNAVGLPFDELRSLSHVEQLDDNRIKIPVSMRWNYYLNDVMRLRTFYRFYTDSWGIMAHTASVELPMQVSPSVILSPFFRYHTQSEADDFFEFGQVDHTNVPEFFTSDYDLSDLSSYKVGLGFQYSPVMGIGNFKSPFRKNKTAQFKSLGIRTAYYDRSDGLNAWLVSFDLGFTF